QGAGCGIASTVGELGLENPRGAGAEPQADARAADACGALRDRGREAVLRQREVRQAVIAALELAELGGQAGVIDSRHLADAACERDRLEGAGLEAAAPRFE